MSMVTTAPASDIDLYSDEALFDPYPHYRRLRDQGPAMWMRPTEAYALSRYHDVRAALGDWQSFSSARGTALNEPANNLIAGMTLGSDPPLHDQLRRILNRPLGAGEIRALTGEIEAEADALVERLVARGHFDAATDLAQYLPVSVISHLVGLPEEGRERMLDWGNAAFDSNGPPNARCIAGAKITAGLTDYAMGLRPESVKPGGWAAMAFEAAASGEISPGQAVGLIFDFVGPSLDTTIFATTSAIWLFATHPEQWDLVRDNPELIPGAINEVLRLESPIQTFSRYVTRDYEIGDVVIPAGSRALVMFGSANRDERKWDEPERFDVRRKAAEHLAFGHGEHKCVGLPLARLELRALLTALARRVRRFELGTVTRGINNTLRGLSRLDVTVN